MSRGGADARGLPGKAGPGPPLPCPRPRPPSRPAGPTDDMGWRRPQAAYWVVSAPSWLGPPCGPGVSDRPGRGCGGWGRRRCRPRGQLDTPQPASLSSRSGHAHACHRDRPGHGASCPGTPHRGSGRPLGPQDGPVPGDGSGGGPPGLRAPPCQLWSWARPAVPPSCTRGSPVTGTCGGTRSGRGPWDGGAPPCSRPGPRPCRTAGPGRGGGEALLQGRGPGQRGGGRPGGSSALVSAPMPGAPDAPQAPQALRPKAHGSYCPSAPPSKQDALSSPCPSLDSTRRWPSAPSPEGRTRKAPPPGQPLLTHPVPLRSPWTVRPRSWGLGAGRGRSRRFTRSCWRGATRLWPLPPPAAPALPPDTFATPGPHRAPRGPQAAGHGLVCRGPPLIPPSGPEPGGALPELLRGEGGRGAGAAQGPPRGSGLRAPRGVSATMRHDLFPSIVSGGRGLQSACFLDWTEDRR